MNFDYDISGIDDMEGEQRRFVHVVGHLYRRRERWGQVVHGLGDRRRQAIEAGCLQSELVGRYPKCRKVSESCRSFVLDDHDLMLAPAYRRAIRQGHEAGLVATLAASGGRRRGLMFVGSNGVTVIARETSEPGAFVVKTAYRVVPGKQTGMTSEAFFKAAVRKLRDKASKLMGGE